MSAAYLFYTAYGVATISRLLKTIGLVCKSALEQRRHSAKETYNLQEPTHRSHSTPVLFSCIHLLYTTQFADRVVAS